MSFSLLFYAVEQLILFAVDIFGQKQAALGAGSEQYLAAKICNAFKNSAAVGQIFVVGKARKKSDALYLADLAHNRLDIAAVKPVKFGRERLHIGVISAAAAQNIGDERVHRRRFAVKLSQQADAQTSGLEFVVFERS